MTSTISSKMTVKVHVHVCLCRSVLTLAFSNLLFFTNLKVFLKTLRNCTYWFMSTVNANFSVNQMFSIICSWKLMNHLNCFGDKRLREKSSYAVLKCVVWLYSVITAFLTMEFQKNKQEVKQFELCSNLSSACKLSIFPSNWNILVFVVYFASLTLTWICKLPFIWQILLETKMSPLISQIINLPFWAPCSLWLSRF